MLRELSNVPLPPEMRTRFEKALSASRGTAIHRHRKHHDGYELLALETVAPERIRVELMELRGALRACIWLRVPVACWHGGETVVEESFARLGLEYPEIALSQVMAGYSFVSILEPRDVFHPNVSCDFQQRLCLAPTLPPAVPARELMLSAYGALAMQTVTMDQFDSAGVMNLAAATWWQDNHHRLPLSREPFLSDPVKQDL